ncbi:OmpA family protein [Aliagarivorans taiwanensis]|uniref:OmpA family protein n=1 Tax=Aliagarivorans taiwanensis TaxID=561966 RepID=UPI00146FC690|nr:OmpA family protein [Aliagarivorans taiwanensis]
MAVLMLFASPSFANDYVEACGTGTGHYQVSTRVGKVLARGHRVEGWAFNPVAHELQVVAPAMSGFDQDCQSYAKQNAGRSEARVYFDFDKSSLTKESLAVLSALDPNAFGQEIVLEGHTCTLGSQEYNQALGMRRAEQVKQQLLAGEFSDRQIEARSQGQNQPIADNATKQGRELNRRVDITSQL